MKYISTILSIAALALVGVIFVTQNREIAQLKKQVDGAKRTGCDRVEASNFKIAYFDLDTLQARYELYERCQESGGGQGKCDQPGVDQSGSEEPAADRRVAAERQYDDPGGRRRRRSGNTRKCSRSLPARKQELEQKLYKFEEEERNKIRKRIEDFRQGVQQRKELFLISSPTTPIPLSTIKTPSTILPMTWWMG